MTGQQTTYKWMRLKEILVTTLVGWLPTAALGVVLRNLIYSTIFKRIGKSVYIQDGVEFIGANNIEIGDEVYLYRGVRINGRDNNCRIWIGNQVALDRGIDIAGGENCQIEIGERTFIGPYTCIGGPGNVKIGKDCLIAAHTGIIANNHLFVDPVQKIRDQGLTRKGITIEDDCWLGYGVKVLDGVTIGQGSVIGAGAVVTKDIPPYSIAVGVPARPIGNRLSKDSVKKQKPDLEYVNKDDSHIIPHTAAAEIEQAVWLNPLDTQVDNHNLSMQEVFENLLQVLFESIRQAMQVDTIAMLLGTEGGQQLAVRATLGLEEEVTTGVKIPVGQGFAGRIAAQQELMIVDDLSKIEIVSPILRQKGLHSMLGVPLLVKDKAIGVFHVGTFRSRRFTKNDAQQLQLVAERIGLAIEPLFRLWQSPKSL